MTKDKNTEGYTNHNHAAMRCKTSTRHRRRPWYFVLVANMHWFVRVTWFWFTFGGALPKKRRTYERDELDEPLDELTNEELLSYGTMRKEVTPLENELLHRLEIYIDSYGDFLGTEEEL